MNGKIGMPSGKRHFLSGKDKIIVTLKNRFYSKVLLPNENGCMEWIGSLSKLGYGLFWNITNGITSAHRLSYLLHYGHLSRKLDICHKCDNPKCVAPDHLYMGTAKDNMKDRTIRKRYFDTSGENHPGHKLTEEDIKDIRKRLLKKEKHREIAELYKVDKTTITAINLKRIWRNVK